MARIISEKPQSDDVSRLVYAGRKNNIDKHTGFIKDQH